MALDLNQFKADLKTEFSNSPDPALKALTDTYWEKIAELIDAYIKTGQVTVSGGAETVNIT